MIVINDDILTKFAWKHNQAVEPLKSWLNTVKKARWRHLMDVKQIYPSTDGGAKGAGYTIFNIKGNSYRIVSLIDYKRQIIEVVTVLTHAEYDKWNKK